MDRTRRWLPTTWNGWRGSCGRASEPACGVIRASIACARLNSLHIKFLGKTMNRRDALKAFAGLALCPLCQPAFAAEGTHWSYEGATGPAKWGDVDAASKVCTIGLQQSPIDIVAPIKSQLPPLKLSWPKTADTIVNNGHTIQLNFAAGGTLTLGDKKFNLLQVHFHRPSEHMIAGKSFPMEAHFVHRADSGGLAVVGVLMSTGKPNAAFT